MWRRCALVVTRSRRLYSTQVGFGALGVDSRVVSALETEFGITAASAMQAQLLRATDAATNNVLVRQHTGSGKTLAVAAGMLSLAVREHDALRSLGLDEASALAVQQANTVVVVPNRELAFQIEGWISRLLAVAYPQLPRARVVGRFVSGAPYEAQQRGVLRRHGVPAILVGTPRCLLELAYPEDGAAVLALRAPELLQVMAEKPPAEWAACVGKGAEALRGVRRLVLDEVDGMLRLPNRHATERQKQLRKDKPKPGQVFVDRLLATLHVTNIAKALRPPPPPAPAPTPPASNARGWQKAADRELARGSSALAAAPRQQQTNIVSGHSLQIVAVSATANKDVRNWMVHRGWMTARPLMIDNDDAGVGVPAQTTHHCLVIENDRAIRNLRPRDSSRAEADALKEVEEEGELPAGPQPLPMMEQMAEVAANVIHELRPRGSVVIFTRSDASTAQFGRVLEAHGVVARDIMTRFDAELGQQIDAAKGKAFVDAQEKYATTPPAAPELHVFLATEEAARGLDLPDASLVLILDIPKSVASYAHLAGRTARFGQPGTVVTVVPVGRLGWFESKMRGIYAALNITPKKADFIQH